MLSTVKVASDPAQVIVNHASFRVQLAGPASHAVRFRALPQTAHGGSHASHASHEGAGARVRPQRRAPVVWSGRTRPGESGATELLKAATQAGRTGPDAEAGVVTRVLPRAEQPVVRSAGGPPAIVGQRGPQPLEQAGPEPLLRGVRPAGSVYDEDTAELARAVPEPEGRHRAPASDGPGTEIARRQAYFPGHRMNLGVVLLPMRIFLGLISVYAGMGKLCDPVYFDGGERGSMVTWLQKLEPWSIASPLHEFAVAHPVGSGLTVAFLQVVVGVLTILGLWQRLAASVGTLLSLSLLMTVSWSTVPAYDAPDIIYLAAWSPLIIAGAPVYSVDARLATGAWRKLGPRADIWALRGRVLRRGGVLAGVVVGLTLLIGSVLGGAVRSAQQVPVPKRGEQPVNQLPGSPLPTRDDRPEGGWSSTHGPGRPGAHGSASESRRSSSPSASPTAGTQRQSSEPSQSGGNATVEAPQQTAPPQQAPGADGPSDGLGSGSDDGAGKGGDSTPGSDPADNEDGTGGNGGGLGGLLG